MKNIEEHIWKYVEGSCSLKEQKELDDLLSRDPTCRLLYDKIKALHIQLNKLELEEPSMSFERNLMEKIETEPTPGRINALIDMRIIRGIAVFFLLSIFSLLAWAFYLTDWSHATVALEMPVMHWEKYINRPFIIAFLFFDMVLGLYFIDYWIRNKPSSN
ncbi:MAG: hypothetical protein ACKOWL_04650 [Sphingobacteriaceae bacterium]